MNARKALKFSVRGIPIIPVLAMFTTIVAAALVASATVQNTLTISSSSSIVLEQFTGGVCTSTPYTSQNWGTVSDSNAHSFSGTQFCVKNTGNTQVWIGGTGAFTLGTGSPTGSTTDIVFSGTTTSITGATRAIAPGATDSGTGTGYTVTLAIVANTAAGTYTWNLNANAYDNAGGT